ncbi:MULTISPECIES: caspase, EACC1-associated type [unclassified Coleofasciculus]|uniref:caspase, EACC1-associated type n=1 Tax=unclassified Coleofasciculus TaxID=2692782 RepID=UPI00187FB541|nr:MULTISPECIES: caspase family protein [unclassified Coleofasciculus]MBE9129495.1 caspase family protein [Coleofasciculus sp. LEGE 07081]MBE9152091.1 caspase family protein [Coleofasciculus sp. LEGE 07092]
MSKKIALLIGVSEYGDGLTTLLTPPNDVVAMQRVLQSPALGQFDEVKSLINPDLVTMQRAIKMLFASCKKEDLVLLFFSGHGITDDDSNLYLTTHITAKDDFEATAVPANFVHLVMNNSYARRQVIILDCCYSGAFAEGWRTKSVGVNIKKQLGAEGRVVLTSSTATQTSFEQEGESLSLYTKYLVEGIETGEADYDKDGIIYVRELHEYAKEKVQEIKPKMKPEIILDKEGFNIILIQSKNTPSFQQKQKSPSVITKSKNKFHNIKLISETRNPFKRIIWLVFIIISIPVGFIGFLILLVIFMVIFNWNSIDNQESGNEITLKSINDKQKQFYIKYSRFSFDLDDIKYYNPENESYLYKIEIADGTKYIMKAIAKKDDLKSYTAIIYAVKSEDNYRNKIHFLHFLEKFCKTEKPTKIPPVTPQVSNNIVQCPPGSYEIGNSF